MWRLRIGFWGIGLGTRLGIIDRSAAARVGIANRLRIGGRFLQGCLWP